MDEAQEPLRRPGDTEEVRPLVEELRQALTDGRNYALAEFEYQKSRAVFAGRELRTIAVLGVLALFFLFFALMALTVGTLAALVPQLGAWGAMAAVTGTLFVLTVLCAGMGVHRLARMRQTLASDGDAATPGVQQ